MDLIVENHGSTDALSVVQMCDRIEKYNIFYIEEVTVPDPKLTKFVRDQIHIPIASGERCRTDGSTGHILRICLCRDHTAGPGNMRRDHRD